MLLGKVSLISIIGWKFFDIQILKSKKYTTLSKNNQISIKILYPVRGEITDRNGRVIMPRVDELGRVVGAGLGELINQPTGEGGQLNQAVKGQNVNSNEGGGNSTIDGSIGDFGIGGGTGSGRTSTSRTASKASRSRTGRSRTRCDIRTKIDISPLINSNLVKDNLAEVAYFVQEIRN